MLSRKTLYNSARRFQQKLQSVKSPIAQTQVELTEAEIQRLRERLESFRKKTESAIKGLDTSR